MSERLGHASTTITADTYSHVIASMGANAAERVAAMIFGAFDHERRFALITPHQVARAGRLELLQTCYRPCSAVAPERSAPDRSAAVRFADGPIR